MKRIYKNVAVATLSWSILVQPALATNGFLSHCAGPIKCATGGSGAALPSSAIDALVNPALTAKLDNHLIGEIGLFSPIITMDSSAADLGNKIGKQKSRLTAFPEFSGGTSYKLNDDTVLSVAIASLGGMGTKYKATITEPLAATPAPVFNKGFRYRLIHASPAVAWDATENVALGGGLLLGYADVRTDTAKPVGMALAETTGNNKLKRAFGIGLRVGALWKANELASFGLSYATPTKFKKFRNYNDVFLGSLDTPMNFVVGSAWHVTSDTDILLDIKEIFFKRVKPFKKAPADGGFGWNNQTIYMVGLTHKLQDLSISLGYNYGKSPIRKNRTFANTLAPGIVEHHFNAGVGYKLSATQELYLNGFYVPKKTQIDPGTGDRFSQAGKGSKVSMYQYGIQLGMKYAF